MVNLTRMQTLIGCERRLEKKILVTFARATKTTTTLTGMPRGANNHSQVEDGAIDLAELKAAYADALHELQQMKDELSPLLKSLDNPDEIAIMQLRYIDGHSPAEMEKAVPMSARSMFYHLKAAERKMCQMFPDQVTTY